MLNKLSLYQNYDFNTGDIDAITIEEIDALHYHVTQYDKTEDGPSNVDILKSWYSKIPDELKYTGPIYRGIGINPVDVPNLISNFTFQSSDTREGSNISVVSWTSEKDIALEFAANKWILVESDHIAGLVIQSDTSKHEIIMEWNGKIWTFLDSEMNLPNLEEGVLEELGNFDRLGEVGVLNQGAESYTMCEDVLYLTVRQDAFFYDEEMFDSIMQAYGDGDRWRLNNMRNDPFDMAFRGEEWDPDDFRENPEEWEIPYNELEWVWFECKGDGSLSMVLT